MKIVTEHIHFNTKKPFQLVRITDKVHAFLKRSKIKDGFILVSAMHITASIFVNDNESGLHKDIEIWLQKLAPKGPDYNHHQTGEDNGDAHLKSLLMGHQVTVPITNGEFDFGPWQEIFYAEFDGQRKKRVLLKAIGE